MINRRNVLGTLAVGGASALLAPSASLAVPAMTMTPSVPPPVLGPRMNFEQADKISRQDLGG